VFIGKSLVGRGGQNPVEAVLAGRPVVFGPHMENFAALTRELLAVGGAISVRDSRGLGHAMSKLLADPASRTAMARLSTKALERHRGATARTADLVERSVAKG
jgi:3-deoxy-D-manno-octulosonic-acid transferase